MTFSEYEVEEKDTLGQYVRQLSQDEQYRELILGLYEETAEVTSPIRRSIKGNYHEQEIDFEHLKEELGDVLWYIAQIASQLPNVDFQQVAIANLIKTHTIHQKELTSTETDLDFTEYVQGYLVHLGETFQMH